MFVDSRTARFESCLLTPAPCGAGKGLGEFNQAGFSGFAGFVEGFVGDVFPLLDGVQDSVDFSGGFGFADLVNSTYGVCWFVWVALSHQGWVSRSNRRAGGPFRIRAVRSRFGI